MRRFALAAAGLLAAGVTLAGCSSSDGSTTETVVTRTATATATSTATSTVTAEATVTAHPVVTKVVRTKTKVRTETYTPPPTVAFTDGVFRVGSELKPGTYHTDGDSADGTGCYFERDNKGDGIDKIIENYDVTGPTTVDIVSSDYAVMTSGGCDWERR